MWRHTLTWRLSESMESEDGDEISCSAGHDSTAEEVRMLKQLAAVTVRRCEIELEERGEPA